MPNCLRNCVSYSGFDPSACDPGEKILGTSTLIYLPQISVLCVAKTRYNYYVAIATYKLQGSRSSRVSDINFVKKNYRDFAVGKDPRIPGRVGKYESRNVMVRAPPVRVNTSEATENVSP